MIVCKFGGTSVKDSKNMRQCADIISQDLNRKLIVLSATAGTTNLLSKIAETIESQESTDDFLEETYLEMTQRHRTLYAELLGSETCERLEELFSELHKLIFKMAKLEKKRVSELKGELLSFGERLSSLIFSRYLKSLGMKVVLFDVRKVMKTSRQAKGAIPSFEKIDTLVIDKLLPKVAGQVVVTQGFIGRDSRGHTTILGRGGSDYSASILAGAAFATKLEIWTDVPGIKSSDPNIVKETVTIKALSYKEAAELSNFGAKVIHPLTLGPVQKKNIPIFIKSTFAPEIKGTEISSSHIDERPVKAIAKRDHQTLLTLSSLKMIGAPGFLAKVFKTLNRFQMNIDLVTTSEASVAITLDGNNNGYGSGVHLEPKLIKELRKFCHLKIENNLSLIALIGNRPDGYFNFSQDMSLLKEMRVRLFCQGASLHNVCFLVPSENANYIMNHLHRNITQESGAIKEEVFA